MTNVNKAARRVVEAAIHDAQNFHTYRYVVDLPLVRPALMVLHYWTDYLTIDEHAHFFAALTGREDVGEIEKILNAHNDCFAEELFEIRVVLYRTYEKYLSETVESEEMEALYSTTVAALKNFFDYCLPRSVLDLYLGGELDSVSLDDWCGLDLCDVMKKFNDGGEKLEIAGAAEFYKLFYNEVEDEIE